MACENDPLLRLNPFENRVTFELSFLETFALMVRSLNPFENRVTFEPAPSTDKLAPSGLNPFENRVTFEQDSGSTYIRESFGLNPFENRVTFEHSEEMICLTKLQSKSLREQGYV